MFSPLSFSKSSTSSFKETTPRRVAKPPTPLLLASLQIPRVESEEEVDDESLGEPARVLPFDFGHVHSGSVRNCAGSLDNEDEVVEVEDDPPGEPTRKVVSPSWLDIFDTSKCNERAVFATGVVASIV